MKATDGWVSLQDFCENYGVEAATVHTMVQKKQIVRGLEYSVPERRGPAYVHHERLLVKLRELRVISEA